ncbi:hypothetical protein [Polyangium jinanense]|uniref:Uncharacterized protein n=1 Tax=Polyangium jinanense TaxID=2829994 RepID=A0A9X3XGY7_9BACT|nr:hypothetical protein [Polyangium jinanense]MDC3961992.1 hypothetical protein [Polyangium jinanense]MDC3988888.1 hypothetical protein [Polyangium jinanense]
MGSSALCRFSLLAFACGLSALGCGRGATQRAAEAPLAPEPPTYAVVIAPGTYFPDWPSLSVGGEPEYDETRSIEVREQLPPQGPAAQIPMRMSGGPR